MKLLSLLFSVFFLTKLCAEEISKVLVGSTIDQVTVYEDQAKVERSTTIDLLAGKSFVIFTNLPLTLDQSSVNISGASRNETKILGIEIREEYLEGAANRAVEELKVEIQTVNDQKKVLTDEKAMWNEQLDFLRKARKESSEMESSTGNRFEEIKKLYEFQQQEIGRISTRQREIAALLRPIEANLTRLKEELERISSGDSTRTLQVRVAVESKQSTRAKFLLNYVISNASWSPEYTARVNTDESTVELSTYGVVRQDTGEDWSNIKLWLSTARPSVGGRMPQMNPQWIEFFDYARPSAIASMIMKKKEALAEGVDSFKERPRDQLSNSMTVEKVRLDNRGFNTTFEIKTPTTIPSDGETHKNMIGVQSFTSQLDYVTTPKLAELAYLRTKLTNTTEFPLLAGTVNLFRDGDFVGKSYVNFIAAGAGFDFYLGVDDAIKITRKVITDQTGESGLVSKKKTLSRKYEISVENFRNKTQSITIFDQIPLLKNEAIKLSDLNYEPKPTAVKNETGEVNWQIQVQPNKKEIVTLSHQLEWPADKQLIGF